MVVAVSVVSPWLSSSYAHAGTAAAQPSARWPTEPAVGERRVVVEGWKGPLARAAIAVLRMGIVSMVSPLPFSDALSHPAGAGTLRHPLCSRDESCLFATPGSYSLRFQWPL